MNCDKIKKHIKTVSLGGEYGDSGRITKFQSQTVYWFFTDDSEHTKSDELYITNLFDEISQLSPIIMDESPPVNKV